MRSDLRAPPPDQKYWDNEFSRAFQNMALFRRYGHEDLAQAENRRCVEALNKMHGGGSNA